jgi:2'-5' RNA ligase
LKSYFLVILIPKDCAKEMSLQVQSLNDIFVSQNIPVKWNKQEKYYISIIYFGRDLNFLQRFWLKRQLTKYALNPFEMSFGKPKIGISNRYKELVYLPVEKGADELRGLLLTCSKHFKFKREHSFIPHLTLGRVSKDLSEQEYRNLHHEIETSKLNKIVCSFITEKVYLVETDDESLDIIASS